MEWETLKNCLQSSDDTAKLAGRLIVLAQEVREGDWKADVMVREGQADDPPAAALLLRSIRANELYTAALRDVRLAIVARHATING